MSKTKRLRKKVNSQRLFLEAFVASKGKVGPACSSCGLSRKTPYRWLEVDSFFKQLFLETKQKLKDKAEVSLPETHELIFSRERNEFSELVRMREAQNEERLFQERLDSRVAIEKRQARWERREPKSEVQLEQEFRRERPLTRCWDYQIKRWQE